MFGGNRGGGVFGRCIMLVIIILVSMLGVKFFINIWIEVVFCFFWVNKVVNVDIRGVILWFL